MVWIYREFIRNVLKKFKKKPFWLSILDITIKGNAMANKLKSFYGVTNNIQKISDNNLNYAWNTEKETEFRMF